MASSGSAVASTRPIGSWRGTSSTRCSARRPPGRGRRGPRTGAWSAPPRRTRGPGSPRSSRRSRRWPAIGPTRPGAARGPAWHRGAGGRRARQRSWTCSGRSCRVGRSSKPRSPGPPGTKLAMSLDDVLARRMRLAAELPDRGASIAPRVAAILGAELGWGEARQALEVQVYLASARREYGVPPPDGPEPAASGEPRSTDATGRSRQVQPFVGRSGLAHLGRFRADRNLGLCKPICTAYYPARKRHGSVRGQNVARRNSDSSHG